MKYNTKDDHEFLTQVGQVMVSALLMECLDLHPGVLSSLSLTKCLVTKRRVEVEEPKCLEKISTG
jgi:hypothetical protein